MSFSSSSSNWLAVIRIPWSSARFLSSRIREYVRGLAHSTALNRRRCSALWATNQAPSPDRTKQGVCYALLLSILPFFVFPSVHRHSLGQRYFSYAAPNTEKVQVNAIYYYKIQRADFPAIKQHLNNSWTMKNEMPDTCLLLDEPFHYVLFGVHFVDSLVPLKTLHAQHVLE